MAKLIDWLNERPTNVPPRWATILMWAVLIATPLGGIYGFQRDARADLRSAEVTRCEQRIESRHGSRARALTNLDYVASVLNVIDEFVGIPAELLSELHALEQRERSLVDEQLPVLTLADCLNPPPATTPRPDITTPEEP